jgi:hypothetical protein
MRLGVVHDSRVVQAAAMSMTSDAARTHALLRKPHGGGHASTTRSGAISTRCVEYAPTPPSGGLSHSSIPESCCSLLAANVKSVPAMSASHQARQRRSPLART